MDVRFPHKNATSSATASQQTTEALRSISHEKLIALASPEIAYIDHPVFRQRQAKSWIARQCPATADGYYRAAASSFSKTDQGLGMIGPLAEAPLLSHTGERALFLRMNFAKSQAERLRHTIPLKRPDQSVIARIQAHLAEAVELRNQIARSNLRLVIALAKPLSRSLDHLAELISEGFLPLLRAIELFDVERGFRFSTYATWAVRNHLHRVLKRAGTLREQAMSHELLIGQTLGDHRPWSGDETLENHQRAGSLQRLLEQLNDRERTIVAARFGLEGHPASQSLTAISETIGLSKERVRQILLKALAKLREAATLEKEPLCWN